MRFNPLLLSSALVAWLLQIHQCSLFGSAWPKLAAKTIDIESLSSVSSDPVLCAASTSGCRARSPRTNPPDPYIARIPSNALHSSSYADKITEQRSSRAKAFYAAMFSDADHPVDAQGTMSDVLIESLVISGILPPSLSASKKLLASGLPALPRSAEG